MDLAGVVLCACGLAVLAVLLAVLVATYAVTEVQELGNDVQTTSLEKSASTATEESDDE